MHYRLPSRRACAAALILAFSALFSSQASAQDWKKIAQFNVLNSYITASHFFNPLQGIIGFHWNAPTNTGAVKWTSDGGNTWTDAQIPALAGVHPIVTDIWFKDKDTGWITVSGSQLAINDPRLWRSTDGGMTWYPLPNEPQFVGPASVRQTPNALCVTEPLGIGIWISTDGGITWTTQGVKKNGLEFNDNFNGVATEFHSLVNTTTFLYTTNGGLSWSNAAQGIDHEAWGVYAIKHSKVYVVAPEDTTSNQIHVPSPVLRSTDNGLNWYQESTILPFMATGGIAGVDGVIYVQNTGYPIAKMPHGLLRSVDSGNTWISVNGPDQGGSVNYIYDTRFSVCGCGDIVIVSDSAGGLYKSVTGGDSTKIIPQCHFVDSDFIPPDTSLVCDTQKHIYFLHNFHPNPGPVIIQDISIVDSTLRPVTTSAFYFDSLPKAYTPIPIGDSVAYGIAWHPGAEMDSTASDSLTIRVIFNANYLSNYGLNPYDTVYLKVSLAGLSSPADFSLSAKKIVHDTLATCLSIDTTVTLINKGCDWLAITAAYLAKNNWTLTDTSGKPLTLPIHLPPYGQAGDTLRFRLRATPTSTTLMNDSLDVKMHFEGHDTSFSIFLSTSAKAPKNPVLALSATTINFDSVAVCDTPENPLSLANTGCDTITITKADLADNHFVLLDTNGNPLSLPVTIPPDSTEHILVRFIPTPLTKSSATVTFHFHRSVYSAFDGTNAATLVGVGVSSGKVFFPDSINLGTWPICGTQTTADTTIYLRNSSCDAAQLKILSVPAPFVLVSPTTFPQPMVAGKLLPVEIRYTPTQKAQENATAQIQYLLDNVTTNGTIALTGAGTYGPSSFTTQINGSLAFPTLSECDPPDSAIITIVNPDCDTIFVTSVSLDPGLGAFTAYTNKPLPAALFNKDSLHVTVRVSNFIAGTYSGNVNVQYTLSDGSAHTATFPASITITSGGGTRALTAAPYKTIDLGNFHVCNTPDTTITFTYSGCGSVVIGDRLGGNGFVLTHSNTSVSDGQSFTDTIRYDGSSTGPLSAKLFINAPVTTGQYDTVSITGNVVPLDTVHFSITLSKSTIHEGDIFDAVLMPDVTVQPSAGLTSIKGIFEYPRDHFATDASSLTAGAGLKVTSHSGPTIVGNVEQYSFALAPNGSNTISLTQGVGAVALSVEAMLSDTEGGDISATGIALDGNVPNFSNCVLTATGLSATTSFQTQCGDSILIGILNGKPLVLAADPKPNPVTSETGFQTTVNLVTALDGIVEIKLYDALGHQVAQDKVSVSANGTVPYTFHLADQAAGSYYYTVRFTNSTSSGATRRGMFQLIK